MVYVFYEFIKSGILVVYVKITKEENKSGRINPYDAAVCQYKKGVC